MLNKTFDKLLKRELAKPLHCIDTSVFLESMSDSHLGEVCKSHLNNMGKGKYFRGVMPISVLGEISMVIVRDMADGVERMNIFDALQSFIQIRNISFVTPKKSDYFAIYEIMNAEAMLDELDSEHLVCAKRAGADVFITLDKLLINNPTIESKLGIRITHPKEFVSV